jgi:hypothetical protein
MGMNDPVYAVGDRVNVYLSGQLAVLAELGQLVNDGSPRAAVIERELASEPGTLEVTYTDGSSEFITDEQRLRPIS